MAFLIKERGIDINEAIEIAKRYGTSDSPMFVNGVLDNVATLLEEKSDLVSSVRQETQSKAVNE